MRFIPAEPDIATVSNRIREGDIDLQPDFQRGEVWPTAKQQKLIDTILRSWVVPPVLLISAGQGRQQQVLDGQQRLASIQNFIEDKFPVDGTIEPIDPVIVRLGGLRYSELPSDIQKALMRTPVRMYEITEYRPEEPAEIFFRMNQPTALTPAEKRNAFHGPVRDQIKSLVESSNAEHSVLGLVNNRMAYDDIYARLACTLEYATMWKKVTAAGVNTMYRRSQPISENCIDVIRRAIYVAESVAKDLSTSGALSVKLNKATLYSWLLFFCRLREDVPLKEVSKFLVHFENVRLDLAKWSGSKERVFDSSGRAFYHTTPFLRIYSDRASSRVADVSSVILRDFILWSCFKEYFDNSSPACADPAYLEFGIDWMLGAPFEQEQLEAYLVSFVEDHAWGSVI